MPKASSSLVSDINKRFIALEASRARIEDLFTDNQLPLRTVLHVYEGLFLNAHVAFESFIEELFIGLLLEDHGLQSSRSDIQPRVKVRSHKIAREMIIGAGKSYVDWIPYDKTLQLAQIFFRGGRPFNELSPSQRGHLTRCSAIRNAIAHRSRHSMKKFENHVIQGLSLPPSEKKPAGYLRGFFRTSPVQTRYENLIAELQLIARELGR